MLNYDKAECRNGQGNKVGCPGRGGHPREAAEECLCSTPDGSQSDVDTASSKGHLEGLWGELLSSWGLQGSPPPLHRHIGPPVRVEGAARGVPAGRCVVYARQAGLGLRPTVCRGEPCVRTE